MRTLTLTEKGGEHTIAFVPGRTLRALLDDSEFPVRVGCRDTGACGLCRVRVLSGDAGEPTSSERLLLGDELLEGGVRLACQVRPQHDLTVLRLRPASKAPWRSLDRETEPARVRPAGARLRGLPEEVPVPYGVAVDLGTTHISVSLFELTTARRVAGCRGRNPQVTFGADVVTRLIAATESPAHRRDLRRRAVDAVGDALAHFALREGLELKHVVRVVLVGNTAMLALLSGRSIDHLLQFPASTTAVDCLPTGTEDWCLEWGIHPRAAIEVVPQLAGFVGSDLLAGVAAVGLTEEHAGSLLIDFGTNSEIALWSGSDLWVTSAAGGPAFEGSGLRCGMPAEVGAIARVVATDGLPACTVIGGGEPLGICGTGLVDALAMLLRSGEVSAKGQLATTVPRDGFVLARGRHDVVLTRGDVDLFQRAKGAIGAGVGVLLAKAGMGYEDLQRVLIAGAFGAALDVGHAQALGLVPTVPRGRVEARGNTALAVCELALLHPGGVALLGALAGRARLVDLATCPEFEDLFVEHLYLRPIGSAP